MKLLGLLMILSTHLAGCRWRRDRIAHMFASESVLVDPEPHLGLTGAAGLDWDTSWDRTTTTTSDTDWDPAEGRRTSRRVELRALLDSVRRDGPDADSAQDVPLASWSDAAIVAEAARVERLSRWATARGYELVQELARRRPEPSGDPEERGLSGYAIDEVAVAVGISRWAACRRVAEADALTHRHPQLAPRAVRRVRGPAGGAAGAGGHRGPGPRRLRDGGAAAADPRSGARSWPTWASRRRRSWPGCPPNR